ncbi:hypothetical protein [Hyphomicrobium sp. CS1GBMeth3]|uniref:hypothetical protein n=1 Tax=Hyphomicrobium sp. CS1GBMeth3 TaxID=1892845 RepID=UPI001114CAFD|nr:hypothetical protein [Hyphomicrobium sp. CS1GBMeth3]
MRDHDDVTVRWTRAPDLWRAHGEGAVRAWLPFPLALKDVDLALRAAEAISPPMPTISVVRDRLLTGIARGYGDLDWSALAKAVADDACLATRKGQGHKDTK